MAKYRVAVMFGGRSTEHEVSVVTGIQVMNYLAKTHEVIPIYITKDGHWLTGKKLTSLASYKKFDPKDPELERLVITPDTGLKAIRNPQPKGLLEKPRTIEIDVVFPAFHGMNGEDGTVQGLLELVDLPYVGSGVAASAVCIDKELTKVVLRGCGLDVLEYLAISRAEWEADEDTIVSKIEERFGYPVIVKPARLGSSIAVEVAHDADELKFHTSVASHFDAKIIIEPYLANKVDINCSVLGLDNPQPSILEQPVSKDTLLSFADKYLAGNRERGMEGAKRIIPAPISADMTAKIQRMAVQAFKAVGASGVARIDFLFDPAAHQVYVNEINTLPGSISYYLWEPQGMTGEVLVEKLLELALQAHREKRKTNFSSGQLLLSHVDFLGLKK